MGNCKASLPGLRAARKTGPRLRSADRGVLLASCNKTLKSSSSIKSRSAKCTASTEGSLEDPRLGSSLRDGVSLSMGRLLILVRGEAKTSLKLSGAADFLLEERGEMQIMFPLRLVGVVVLSPCRLATSEKKKDVLTVGVRGGACGVLAMELLPGENSSFALGDCNHASTLDVSKEAETMGLFP